MDFSKRLCKQSVTDMWKFMSIENDNIVNPSSVDTITLLETHYEKVMNHIKSCFYYGKNRLGKKMIRYLIMLCFDTRNSRGGKGWRFGSYWLYFQLFCLLPNTMIEMLPKFSEFGYWKDYQNIYKYSFFYDDKDYPVTKLRKTIIKLFSNQIKTDLEYLYKNKLQNISLCAKWIPKENKSLDKKYKIYKKIVNEFYSKQNLLRWKKTKYILPSTNSKKQKKQFRQKLSKLNKIISERVWNGYDFNCEGKNMHIGKLIYLYENSPMDYKLLKKIYKNPLYNFIEETLEKYNNYDSRLKDTLEPKEFIKFIKKNRPKYTKTEIKID